jgi:hypothetical protein
MGRLTGADGNRVRETAQTARTPSELPPARELLASLAAVFGLHDAEDGYERALAHRDAIPIVR